MSPRCKPAAGCPSGEERTYMFLVPRNVRPPAVLLNVMGQLMAIFHMSIKAGSRSKGGAQYHGRYLRRDERVKVDEDHPVTIIEFNRPTWAIDIDDFWTAADEFERKNGSAYREYEISLPIELGQEENELLVSEWIQQTFPSLVVEAGLHWKDDNPHSHVQVCERILDGHQRTREQFFKRFNSAIPSKGGCKKDDRYTGNWLPRGPGESKKDYDKRRKVVGTDAVKSVRASWADAVNRHIVPLGIEPISSLSNEARGIEKAPSTHIGRKALAMAKKGIIGDRISEAIELEERRAYVITRKANQRGKSETDQGVRQTLVGRTVRQSQQVQAGRPEQIGEEIAGTPLQIRSESRAGNQEIGRADHGNGRGCTELDIGHLNHLYDNSGSSGAAPVVKVHTPGFKVPAYFSTTDFTRKPIAIGLDGGGFTLVKDASPTDEQLTELILDAAGPERERLELFGDAEWLMRTSKMCERLGIEYEYFGADIMQPETSADTVRSESSRGPAV